MAEKNLSHELKTGKAEEALELVPIELRLQQLINVFMITQAEFDALSPPVEGNVYFIVG